MAGRYKAYSEYKDSGVEWLGDIPRKWDLTRIKFLAGLNAPKSEVTKLPANTEVSFLPMEAVGEQGALDVSKTKTLGEVSSGYTYLAEGDVCIAKITPCFENGKGAIVRGVKNGIAFATTEVIPLRCNKECESKFLYYLLTSAPFNKQAEGSMYGAGGQKRVADSFVANYHFSSPSLPEQKQIAAFLDHETGKIDLLIEKQQALIALLKEKRQAVISHAVTKGLNPDAKMKDSGVEWLGDVPEHWTVSKFGRLAFMQEGPGLRTWQFKDSGTRVICVTNITEGGINFSLLEKFISEAEYSSSYKHFTVNKGDILLSSSGNSWGKVARYEQDEKVILNTSTIRINELPHRPLAANYIQHFLQSEACREQLGLAMTGSCQPNFGPTHLNEIKTPLLPIEEQELISQFIIEEAAKYDKPTRACIEAINLLEERRTALISAAVTGKIDVRDWEPAPEA